MPGDVHPRSVVLLVCVACLAAACEDSKGPDGAAADLPGVDRGAPDLPRPDLPGPDVSSPDLATACPGYAQPVKVGMVTPAAINETSVDATSPMRAGCWPGWADLG